MVPGEYKVGSESLEINASRRVCRLEVSNLGDRPIQVGSHFHFFECNRWLSFDRQHAYGMRLNIPAGTAVRFEPGDTCEVELTELAGARIVHGLNGLVNGHLDDQRVKDRALDSIATFERKPE